MEEKILKEKRKKEKKQRKREKKQNNFEQNSKIRHIEKNQEELLINAPSDEDMDPDDIQVLPVQYYQSHEQEPMPPETSPSKSMDRRPITTWRPVLGTCIRTINLS